MSIYGGAELVVVKLANYLTKKGIENTVLTLSISPEVKRDLRGISVITPKEKIVNWNNLIKIILTLRKYVHKNLDHFDVVNVHNFPAELSVFPHKKPTVWMCNEPPEFAFPEHPSFLGRILRSIMIPLDEFVVKNYVDYACVADDFNAKRFKKKYGFAPIVNHYGIDHEFFSKGNKQKAMKMFNLYNKFVILQVGWIELPRNQMESVRTVEKLKDKIQNIKLILAGNDESDYARMLKDYVHRKGLDRYVVFTGHLPRESVRDLYHACHIALFPIKPQGGWLSPFEALCAAKPVITSFSMTAAKIMEKNKIGIVTDDFVEAVTDVYTDPKKYRDMGKKGRAWVRKNLSWDKFCQGMVEIFEKAVAM